MGDMMLQSIQILINDIKRDLIRRTDFSNTCVKSIVDNRSSITKTTTSRFVWGEIYDTAYRGVGFIIDEYTERSLRISAAIVIENTSVITGTCKVKRFVCVRTLHRDVVRLSGHLTIHTTIFHQLLTSCVIHHFIVVSNYVSKHAVFWLCFAKEIVMHANERRCRSKHRYVHKIS